MVQKKILRKNKMINESFTENDFKSQMREDRGCKSKSLKKVRDFKHPSFIKYQNPFL